ncbi:hypothetical protein IQ274_26070 [Nostoc sp. LEGE 12447]|uniref:hypothetical protein n=1 Tax=Nostoc sp. LEGE 12447 TaxID=1828640 RepID=UPI001884494B|nr:hypothetical protein [Nostoc sp. LEGE 12447]MBE9001584.1 hypothetical protein [Nostoc sp. LEGE 12447]
MTNSQPPLPQPELERAGITFEQYEKFTPEKLELWDGYLRYGGQNQLGFHLAVLRNMELLTAIRHTELSLWIEALERHLKEKLETVSAQPEVAQALLNRLNRAMSDLAAVAEYLEG